MPVEDFVAAVRRALAGAQLPRQKGEVSVLLFQTPGWTALLPSASVLLAAAERDRAERFRFERDRTNYVLAHALWRVVLAHCLEVELASLPLQFAPSGQPQLPGTPFATSLSHSRDAVLIGVGRMATLGVDIERTPPRISLEGLIATLCAPDEVAALRDLPAAVREQALLQLWTRKEALLKAFGVGLVHAPSAFSATPDAPVPAPAGLDCPACRVRDLLLPQGSLGSLAAPADTDQPFVCVVNGPRSGLVATSRPISHQ